MSGQQSKQYAVGQDSQWMSLPPSCDDLRSHVKHACQGQLQFPFGTLPIDIFTISSHASSHCFCITLNNTSYSGPYLCIDDNNPLTSWQRRTVLGYMIDFWAHAALDEVASFATIKAFIFMGELWPFFLVACCVIGRAESLGLTPTPSSYLRAYSVI